MSKKKIALGVGALVLVIFGQVEFLPAFEALVEHVQVSEVANE